MSLQLTAHQVLISEPMISKKKKGSSISDKRRFKNNLLMVMRINRRTRLERKSEEAVDVRIVS